MIIAYGFGKVLASREAILAYMENPTVDVEKSFLFFNAAATSKLVGVEIARDSQVLLGGFQKCDI